VKAVIVRTVALAAISLGHEVIVLVICLLIFRIIN